MLIVENMEDKDVSKLKEEVKKLKTQETMSSETQSSSTEDNMNKLLETLANNRNNKEITIKCD